MSFGHFANWFLIEASREYEVGYVVGYFETGGDKDRARYVSSRWGNMGEGSPERFASARALFGLSGAKTEKTNRRSEIEERAISAAKASSATARRQAGIKPKASGAGRKPRPASNKTTANDNKKVALSALKPIKFANRAALIDGYKTIGAFMLNTLNANALLAPPQLKTIVEQYNAEIKTAIKALKSLGVHK